MNRMMVLGSLGLGLFVVLGCAKRPVAPSAAPPPPPVAPAVSVAAPEATAAAAEEVATSPSPPAKDLACLVKARELPGAAGTTVLVSCPAECGAQGAVWGTEVYTDDSAVCSALIHAGVIPAGGGRALVTFAAGQLTYAGSKRNGVQTQGYGVWRRSFYGQSVDASGKPTSPAPEVTDDRHAHLDCTHRGSVAPAEPSVVLEITCPAGCEAGGTLYGTGTYTEDSSVCAAAIHAGKTPASGGTAKLVRKPGQASYVGSTQHGVTSRSWGKYGASFGFE